MSSFEFFNFIFVCFFFGCCFYREGEKHFSNIRKYATDFRCVMKPNFLWHFLVEKAWSTKKKRKTIKSYVYAIYMKFISFGSSYCLSCKTTISIYFLVIQSNSTLIVCLCVFLPHSLLTENCLQLIVSTIGNVVYVKGIPHIYIQEKNIFIPVERIIFQMLFAKTFCVVVFLYFFFASILVFWFG